MTRLLIALMVAQTQPAVRRTTPAVDDPGLVVRIAGGSGGSGGSSGGAVSGVVAIDGGYLRANQGTSLDGGTGWGVFLEGAYGTLAVSASSLPLPTGASTEATLAAASAKLPATLGQKTSANSMAVVIASDQSTVPVSAASLPLPSGASTSALQTTGNTSLSSIDGKVPALGQTTMAASTPVTIASNQTTLAVSAASLPLPTGAATSANQTTLGSQTSKINDGTNTAAVKAASTAAATTDPALVVAVSPNNSVAVTQATASNLRAQTSSESNTGSAAPTQGSLSMSNTTTAAPSYSNNTANALSTTTAGALRVDGSGATQPVSGTVTANAGTNLNTSALALDATLGRAQASSTSGQTGPIVQGATTTAAPSYTTATTNPLSLTTTGGLRVDGSGSTQPVSGTVAATQSGTWNITNVSGTVSLPTGAATEASLVKLPLTQGSTTSGQSGTLIQGAVTTAAPSYTTAQTSPLSLTTAGALRTDSSATTQPISAASLPLPTGASTAANQTTLGSQTSKINDGTNTAAVKAASTAAAATDPALVVAVSPNNSVTVAQATAANLRAQTSAEGATGSAVPTNAMQLGARDSSGNLRPFLAIDTDVSGATIYTQGVSIVGAQFGSVAQASVEANAVPGTQTGLVIRPVLKSASAVATTSVTCATSATAAPASPLASRQSLCIYNNGANTIFIGPVGVTTANGWPLEPGASYCDDLNTTQVYSCIVASGTENARVIEN